VGCLFLAFSAWAPAHAGSLRSGIAAYNRADYVTAMRHFLPLAERGNARAQAYLGFMYSTGRGVPKNYVAAALWTERAAQQGDVAAQYQLGLMYDKGHGVPLDFVEAYKWFNLSSADSRSRGREFGARLREAVATKLTHEELAEAQYRSTAWFPIRERRGCGPAVLVREQRCLK
jgi:hypothetical protein